MCFLLTLYSSPPFPSEDQPRLSCFFWSPSFLILQLLFYFLPYIRFSKLWTNGPYWLTIMTKHRNINTFTQNMVYYKCDPLLTTKLVMHKNVIVF
jgi:hypothetical protein